MSSSTIPPDEGSDGFNVHSELKDIQDNMAKSNAGISLHQMESDLAKYLKSRNGVPDEAMETKKKFEELQKESEKVFRDGISISDNAPSMDATANSSLPPLSPRKLQRQKALGPKSSDVQFATSLSEGLLVECRRLQGIINDRDQAIRTLKEEQEALSSNNAALESKVHVLSDSEDKFKEENWNLESKLQELQVQIKKSSESATRATSEASRLQNDKSSQIEMIESLKLRENELRTQIDSLKSRYDAELNNQRRTNEEIKSENESLHQNILDLNDELSSRPPVEFFDEDYDMEGGDSNDQELESEEAEFETPQLSPVGSPIKATPSRHSVLETQTMKSSLGHAHKLTANLRNTLTKERAEKKELKRLLSEAQEELENLRPGSLKSKRSKVAIKHPASQRTLTSGSGPSVRRVKSRNYSETSVQQSSQKDDWEDSTTDSEAFQSAFETAPDEPNTEDDFYETGQETMGEEDGSDDGQNTETEESAYNTGNDQFDDSRVSYDDDEGNSTSEDNADNLRRTRKRISKQVKRSSHSLRPIQFQSSPNVHSISTDDDQTPIKPRNLAAEFMSEDDLERHAAALGLQVISNDEYDDLIAKAEAADAPMTVEEIGKLAAEHHLEVLSALQLKELQSKVEDSKTKDFVLKSAMLFGLAPIATEEYENLKSPSVDEIMKLADNAQLKALPISEHDKLVKESTRDLTAEELEQKATNIGYVAVPNTQYFNLVSASQSPTMQKVIEDAKAHGLVTLSQSRFNEMTQMMDIWENPTEDDLKAKAIPLGFVVMDSSEVKDLRRLAQSPSPEELSERAKTLGLAIVPVAEYQNLQQSFNEPSISYLQEKLKDHKSTSILDEDYQTLNTLAHNPPQQHLHSKAQDLGLKVLPADELAALSRQANEPDESHIKTKAAALGLVALGSAAHTELLRSVEKPTREEIQAKAEKLGLIALNKSAYNSLSRLANSPTEKEVAEKASSMGFEFVPKTRYAEMVRAANEPTVAEIKNKAESLGLVAITSEKFVELSKPYEPTVEEVEKAASGHGLIAVPVAQYKNIQDKANIEITNSYVESAAASIGLATLATEELHALRNPPTPTMDKIKKVSADHNCTVISNSELQLLRNPPELSINELTDLAKKKGMVTVSNDNYDDLVKPYNPSKEEIEEKAGLLGLIAVPTAAYESLTAEPTKEELVDKIKGYGLVSIHRDDYDELSSRPIEFKPTKEELEPFAKDHGLSLVPVSHLEQLERKVDAPSKDELEQHAAKQGMGLVAVNELEDMKRRLANPSKKELDTVAAQLGLAVVSVAGLQELHKKGEHVSKDMLVSSAKTHSMKVIPNNEYEIYQQYKQFVEVPSLENVKSSGAKIGLDVVPAAELKEMLRKLNDPTIEEVSKAGEPLGLVSINKLEYEELEKNTVDPDHDFLRKHSLRHNMVMLSSADESELRRKATQPVRADIEGWAKKAGLIVLAKDQYASLSERAEKEKSSTPTQMERMSVAAKREHFEDMIRQSKENPAHGEKIMDSIRSLGYVPVSPDEYKRLQDNQVAFEPTKRDLIRAAKTFGLVTIDAEEHKKLLRRGHIQRSSSGSTDLLSIIDDDINTPGSSPSRSPMSKTRNANTNSDDEEITASKVSEIDLETVPSEYLSSLRRMVESPTREDVMSLAKKVGLVCASTPMVVGRHAVANSQEDEYIAISSEEYSALQSKADKYSANADELTARARELGMVTMSTKLLDDLRASMRQEAVKAQEEARIAQSEALRAQDEAKKVQNSSQSVDTMKEKMKDFGLVTLSLDDYYRLKELESKPDLSELSAAQVKELAHNNGLVTVPTSEYMELSSRRPTNSRLPIDEIKAEATKAGLTTLPIAEYNLLKQPVQSKLGKGELETAAAGLGLVVLSQADHKKLTMPAPPPPRSVGTKEIKSIDELKELAEKSGYSILPSAELQSLRDAEQTRSVASEIFLKDVRETPVQISRSHQVQSAVLEDADDISTAESDVTRAAPFIPLPALSELGNSASAKGKFPETNGSRQLMEAPMLRQQQPEQSPYIPLHHTPRALSTATIATATTESIGDRNMIPYITQVVIGEYLFKYTRRIGVTGISDNRHERYFWIHPYSLTLYWSDENPAVENRHSIKTRSAAILSVKSVEDRNPLPPGLYHKSILVKSTDRVIKLTCPTRQRHNIWYNSMLFLLKRSVDDIVFDEEEVTDDYAVDSRFERERSKTISGAASSRHRALSFRRSLAPEMNIRSSRQASISSFQRGSSELGRHSSVSTTSSIRHT